MIGEGSTAGSRWSRSLPISTCLSVTATISPSGENRMLLPLVRPSSRASVQLAIRWMPCSRAFAASAVTKAPSRVSAIRRACSRSSYQDTWLQNSGRTTTAAPSATARSVIRRQVARFSSTSSVTANWTAATRTIDMHTPIYDLRSTSQPRTRVPRTIGAGRMSEATEPEIAQENAQEIEVEAFPGKPPVAIDLTKAAPFGWWAAAVIALVAFIDRVEYNLVAGALPAIQDHFHFSDTVAGAIPTASAIAGVILLLPAGRLADRGRRTSIVGLVVLVWAFCSVLSGIATTFAIFFISRILLGAAGQLYNPPASSLLADYYPGQARGKAFGLER